MQHASEGQPITIRGGDGPLVYGALTGAILVLAGVIALLWRRGERHRDRSLKAAEEAREREVTRTNNLADRIATERVEFGKALEAARVLFAQTLESQRESFIAVIDRERSEFTDTLRAVVERQAQADVTRDAKLTELVMQMGKVVEAAQHRIARREPR
jgi:hypothetical protein